MDEYLKLGAVVRLKNTGIKCLIIGYYPEDPNTGCVYTYLGIDPIYGLSFNEHMLFINKEIISEVIFEGYSDGESDEFRDDLKTYMRTPIV